MTHRPDDLPRITDLSEISPEDFKFRNTRFLLDDEQPYETGRGDSRQALRDEIWRVRNGDIERVLKEFPVEEPLEEQCALWMHAVVGKHFFPDANHRTAVALLRRLLKANEITYCPWSIDTLKRARQDSHKVRRRIEAVELDTLYRRDPLYDRWLEFFQNELVVRSNGE